MSENNTQRRLVKKKGILATVADELRIKEDAESIEDYIRDEIANWLGTNIKRTIANVSTNVSNSLASGTIKLVNRLLYQDRNVPQQNVNSNGQRVTQVTSSITRRSVANDVPYNNTYRPTQVDYSGYNSASFPDYKDLLFKDDFDANNALEECRTEIGLHGGCPVSKLYEIFNRMYGTAYKVPWSYQESGWTNLDNAYPDQYQGQYYLVMPRHVRIR